MTFFLLAVILVILLPLLTTTVLRRFQNQSRLRRLHNLFEEVAISLPAAVSGEVEGKRHGRLVGISFVGAARKPDDKSAVEFWIAASGGVPFQVQGSSGVLFDREFESSSSQPEAFERLKANQSFASALASLKAQGAESLVYAGGGRMTAVFRPYRAELIASEGAGRILDALEELAKAAEAST